MERKNDEGFDAEYDAMGGTDAWPQAVKNDDDSD